MGVLGKDFTWGKDETKIVVIEVTNKEDTHEIAHVYGENEDFNVLCSFPLNIPAQFSKEKVNYHLQTMSYDLPVYTCKISHNLDEMSKEEAFNRILNASEPWQPNVI